MGAAVVLLVLAVGCSGTTGGKVAPQSQCAIDGDCGRPQACAAAACACFAARCIPSLSAPTAWSAEITPPVGETTSAVTETTSLNSGDGMLFTQALAPLSATFNFLTPLLPPANANVTLTIPAKIPGRPDRVFEVRAELDRQALKATFSAPANATNTGGGVIRLFPLPPDDRRSPPRAFTVGSASSFTFTIGSTDDVPLRGRLVDATGTEPPRAEFLVRALQDDVVSNVPTVETSGDFSISIPLSATIRPVRVQLIPQQPTEVHPSYVTMDRMPTANGAYANVDIKLPSYLWQPNAFSLTVAGEAPDEPRIPGALVRATTVLTKPEDPGTATFVRDNVSDSQGVASLSLLPGAAALLRDYEVAVVPPADSAFATLCRAMSIAAGGMNGSPPAMVPLTPPRSPRRPVLIGTVQDADGAPVGDVVIAATPGPDPVPGCTTTRPVPATTVSDRSTGRFSLPLDPGTYQIDYDPPGGSPVPRLTELDVTMTGDAEIKHDVRLPRPGLVEGTVLAADGRTRLVGATVRLYEVRCVATTCTGRNRVAPWLRAVAQTDKTGRFRAVVPLDTSN